MLKPKSSSTARSCNSTIAINQPQKAHSKGIPKKTFSSQLQFIPAIEIDKISLVHHNVTVIDRVLIKGLNSTIIDNSKIKMLYLSNNFISDIEHIQQFPRLETLSLSYNNISKLTNVRYLSPLTLLTHLSLQGNPISKSPMYNSYIIGVIQNSKNRHFKILDKANISLQMRKEAIENWDVYEQSMGELIKNYMKLIYVVQFWKKQSINRIVRKAEKQLRAKMPNIGLNSENFSSQDFCTDTLWQFSNNFNIDKKFMFFLSQAQQDIPTLPTKFLMGVENILNDDVAKLLEKILEENAQSEPHKQGNFINIRDQYLSEEGIDRNQFLPSQIYKTKRRKIDQRGYHLQVYFSSMFDLQQRQRSKICEMKAKIEQKFDSDQGVEVGDVNIVQSILSSVLFAQPYSESKKFYQWKVVQKMFMRMKHWVSRKKIAKVAVSQIVQLIGREIEQNLLIGMTRINGQVKRRKLERMEHILNMKKIGKYRVGLKEMKSWMEIKAQQNLVQVKTKQKELLAEQICQQKIKQFQRLTNQRKLVKICFYAWFRTTGHSKLLSQNNLLLSQLQQQKNREEKMQKKINLLSQLLAAMEEKHKRHVDQQIGSPKQILNEIECSISSNQTLRERTYKTQFRSPESILYESQVYQDTQIRMISSPKKDLKLSKIRKNVIGDKENIKNSSNQQLGFQRKLNSSNRQLKINNYPDIYSKEQY